MAELETFETIIKTISSRSYREWVYLPRNEQWSLHSRCATLEMDEVPPELEDEPDAGIPQFAKLHNLREVVPVETLQEIVDNLRQQNPSATIDEIFTAFEFYYDRDAFIDLSGKRN